jgi:hypothetical protein
VGNYDFTALMRELDKLGPKEHLVIL